jgi:hypothetical protein
LLTYQNEQEEAEMNDERRAQSSKLGDQKENIPPEPETEESEEEKRDEKVRLKSFFFPNESY